MDFYNVLVLEQNMLRVSWSFPLTYKWSSTYFPIYLGIDVKFHVGMELGHVRVAHGSRCSFVPS